MKCGICEQGCNILEGGTGLCRMYTQTGGQIVERLPDSYLAVLPFSITSAPP
ncbi:hypothetical protein [Methanofollis aquaemaris]|uniref:hypothetical protein n=1 Tax=Methanofollis aquaemaris TaxID=126734 RepID=UPI002240D51A|nr:hypothetical protein [Methanofollis aquaemaris]